MKYNLHNTIFAGKPVKHVFDANGLEWTQVVECDTETGRILRHLTDRDGNAIVNSLREGLETEEVFAAPPLHVVFRESQQ